MKLLRWSLVLLCVLPTIASASSPVARSLVLILVDELTTSDLEMPRAEGFETAAIDRLIRQSVKLKSHIVVSPDSAISVASLLSGSWPPAKARSDNEEEEAGTTTLSDVLSSETFSVAGYSADKAFAAARPFVAHLSARDELAEASGRWLAEQAEEQRFFLLLHDTSMRDSDGSGARASSLLHLDAEIGDVMKHLEARGSKGDTLLVLVSSGGAGPPPAALGEARIRTPLLMRGLDLRPTGKSLDGLVSGIDIMPTVLELLAIDAPASVEGRSFAVGLRGGKPRRSFRHITYSVDSGKNACRAIRTDHWKLVRCNDAETDLVFELPSDPDERLNRLKDAPDPARFLADKLVAWEARGSGH